MKRTRLDKYNEYSAREIEAVIDDWIKSRRDRAVLKYKLIDGLTFEQILNEDFPEKETATSVDTIKSIVYKSESILFKHLKF